MLRVNLLNNVCAAELVYQNQHTEGYATNHLLKFVTAIMQKFNNPCYKIVIVRSKETWTR